MEVKQLIDLYFDVNGSHAKFLARGETLFPDHVHQLEGYFYILNDMYERARQDGYSDGYDEGARVQADYDAFYDALRD